MRRLTYAPKAYVFIRSRNHGNQVFDLSDYVIEGSVDRVVNDVSKATLVLRNAFFELSPEGKDSFFLPMDGITIWLQRIKNKPIQVFTGYLDSVPYLQMYPGNCMITASCTLKRLLYTYFDPTINATSQFFGSMGWQGLADGEGNLTGQFINPQGITQTGDPESPTSSGGAQNVFVNGKFNASTDSGIGSVIKPFMVQIAGWNPNQVHVADLPTDLPAKGAKLYNSLQMENLAMLDATESALKGFMTISADPNSGGQTSTLQLGVVNKIYKAASDKNVDPTTMVLAGLVLSGLDQSYVGPDGQVGMYAIPNQNAPHGKTNTNQDPGLGPYSNEDFFASPYDAKNAKYDGKTAEQMIDPTTATYAFAKRLMDSDPTKAFAKAAGKGNLAAMAEWISKAAGVELGKISNNVAIQYDTAKRLVAAQTGAIVGKGNPILEGASANQITPGLTWSNTNSMFSADTSNDRGVFNQHYPNAYDSLAPYAYVAHKTGLVLVKPPKVVATRNDIIVLQDPNPKQEKANKVKQFFDWAKTQGGASIVRFEKPVKSVVLGGPSIVDDKDTEYHNGQAVSGAQQQQDWPAGYVYIQVPKNSPYPVWTGNPDTSVNNSNSVPPGSPTTPNSPPAAGHPLTFEDVATIGLQSAFFAQVNFPGDSLLSNTLRGDKALMNDIPVMEAVQQFCGGSMRNFMSLPDGSFCAFYPDYFGGSNRKPYWSITDMEIMDMGIQLTDQALATHVYVTGAVANSGTGEIQQFFDQITTLGVVTLQHVFGDGNFISGDIKGNKTGDILGREQEAYQFLKFYGARPKAIQQPLITNPIFEFLYAWQLFMYMWTMQFQTRCEFTFQPEVMAGGRIAFPDHGIEMYVESVSHRFSYESGFNTSAVLTAPTTTVKDPNAAHYMPGMALAGNDLGNLGGIGG